MENINIIPTSYMFQDINEYRSIVETYKKLGIKTIRVNCTRFSLDKYVNHIYQFREEFGGISPEIMVDIPYPGIKMRVEFGGEKDYFQFVEGKYYYFIKDSNLVDDINKLFIDSELFYNNIKLNNKLFLGDGEIILRVTNINAKCIETIALNSGNISYRKAIYSKDIFFRVKDEFHAYNYYSEFIKEVQPEVVVLSFVESEGEIISFKKMVRKLSYNTNIIAKIETPNGVDNIEKIIEVSDGIMIGRGDLGITCSSSLFPEYFVKACKACSESKTRTIVATDILNSTLKNVGIPSRADLIDVYMIKKYGIKEFVASSQIAYDKNAISNFSKLINSVRV